MANWDLFNNYLTVEGATRRDRIMSETKASIQKRAKRSPAYKTVLIDGIEQDLVITSATELNTKKIDALPNEHIYAGSIVTWNNHHWIITQVDCEDEIYQRGKMLQCNIYLKWQNSQGEIIGRFGYAQNIAEFSSGIVENRILNSIQATHKIQMPMDEETILLQRDKRFLIDVYTEEPEAYIVTDRNVFTMNYDPIDIDENYVFNGKGKVLMLTITQTQLSEKDNKELMIADYFDPIVPPVVEAGECTILYKGQPTIKLGGSNKTFSPEFKDMEGNIIDTVEPVWSVITLPEFQDKLIITYNNKDLKIKVPDDLVLYHAQIKIILDDVDGIYHDELFITVVNLYG